MNLQARLDSLRDRGWVIGCHNDYRQGGVLHTYYLFTNGDFKVQGEAVGDMMAIDQVEANIVALEKRQKESSQ